MRRSTTTSTVRPSALRLAGAALLAAASLVAAAPVAGAADKSSFTTGQPGRPTIFFASDREAGVSQIYSLDQQTKKVTRLTVAGTMDEGPSVNKDRTWVAFSATPAVLHAKSRIEIMATNGSQRRVVADDSTANLRDPSLSPDGRFVVFTRQQGNDQQIWLASTEDGSRRQMTRSNQGTNRQPVWSPDGTKIAFASTRNGHNDIWMMGFDGLGVERVTYDQIGVADPAWSPDGKKIAYSLLDPGTQDSEVQWVDAFSVNVPHRVSNNPAGDDGQPTWCADGKTIIYTSEVDGKQKLMSGNEAGTTVKTVTGKGQNNFDADCGYPNYAA